jgi:hypothetical protein
MVRHEAAYKSGKCGWKDDFAQKQWEPWKYPGQVYVEDTFEERQRNQ